MKKLVSFAAVLTTCGAVASEVLVPPYAVEKVNVDTEAVQADPVIVSKGGSVRKTGAGTWTLPSGKLSQEWDARVEVEEGRLDLQATTTEAPSFADVETILGKSASWFDASKEASRVMDGDTLTDWLDSRETGNGAAGYNLVRAVTDFTLTDKSPVYRQDATYGKSGLYFGGIGSDIWMKFCTPDGNEICYKAYHVYAIHGETAASGFPTIFGTRNKYLKDAKLQPYYAFCSGGTGFGNYSVWSASYNVDMLPIYNGRTYINGRQINPFEWTTWPFALSPENAMPRGFSLLEAEMLNSPALVSCLDNDRDYTTRTGLGSDWQTNQYGANRQGGDYLCEIVIFTNRLTETERMKVSSYLINKWLGAPSVPKVSVALAKGAKVALPPSGLAVTVEGEGQIVKSDDTDEAFSLKAGSTGYFGSVRLAAGGIRTCSDLPFDLESGETLTVSQDYSDRHIVRTAGDRADVFVKDGDGALTIQSISGPEKNTLRVNGGSVTLTARRRSPQKPFAVDASRVRAVVPNASFEEGASASQTKPLGTGANGWHGQIDGSGEAFFFNWTVNRGGDHDGQYWNLPLDPPDGVAALAIKQSASAWAEVEIPEDGRYELSFYAAGRRSYADLALELMIGPDADNLQRIGGFRNVHTDLCYELDPTGRHSYFRYSYMTPHLTAGKHQLWFRHTDQTVDRCVLIDCVELVKEDLAADGVWKIPNGNFCDLDTSYSTFADPKHFNVANAAALAGWTCVQPEAPVQANVDGVAPALLQMNRIGQNDTWSGRFYHNRNANDGSMQLQLCQGGYATTRFTPPKGEFCLRGNLALMVIASKSAHAVAFHATVTPDGGTETDLGQVVRSNQQDMYEECFPTPFVSDGETPVTLKLWIENLNLETDRTSANGNVADLALVDARVTFSRNLVDDGGFDSMTGWTIVKENATYYPERYLYNNDKGWGNARYNGHACCLKMTGPGTVSRKIKFPAAGFYRLQAAARSRTFDGKITNTGPNGLHFYVARGGVTNEIAAWNPVNTNYVESAWCFRVTDAGEDYDFGIRGVPPPNKNINPLDMTSFVDGVEITRTEFAEETPNLSEHTRIRVAEGAKLRLDYPGTNRIAVLSLGGRGRNGVVTAETDPDYVSGPGALEIVPDVGAVILLR